jgi:hypothetical protein
MNKKNFFLIGAILSALIFIGFLGETEPKTFFGYSVSIWFFRAFWLLNTFIIVKAYLAMKKIEK